MHERAVVIWSVFRVESVPFVSVEVPFKSPPHIAEVNTDIAISIRARLFVRKPDGVTNFVSDYSQLKENKTTAYKEMHLKL